MDLKGKKLWKKKLRRWLNKHASKAKYAGDIGKKGEREWERNPLHLQLPAALCYFRTTAPPGEMDLFGKQEFIIRNEAAGGAHVRSGMVELR